MRGTKARYTVGNAGTRHLPEWGVDAECGKSVDVTILWCRIVLRLEVEVIREGCGGVMKNDIAAIGDWRGLVDVGGRHQRKV